MPWLYNKLFTHGTTSKAFTLFIFIKLWVFYYSLLVITNISKIRMIKSQNINETYFKQYSFISRIQYFYSVSIYDLSPSSKTSVERMEIRKYPPPRICYWEFILRNQRKYEKHMQSRPGNTPFCINEIKS